MTPQRPAPRAPRVHHPLFARFYARFSESADTRGGLAALRTELLAGLSGRVVEIGAGNGLNFAHYPAGVTEVVAVEPEPHLRRLAEEAARRAAVPVTVLPGTAEALPGPDGSFDAAVASLVLCTVRDVPEVLTELRRVLRPGGELRFFEHGAADTPGLARVQRGLDRTVWPLLFGGCHTSRTPLAAIEAAGFDLVSYRSFDVPEQGPRLPSSPCVLGTARR
ncbi:class I SAM-dependent methyltransferase [Streptomyces sp. TLI_105]|uniref:class I SAM-dependent methyltransferase n=1 Tax=Streptomyces sp. TLI_105 TaxID=1881019 RepID=UPI00089BB04B|nr:class I SAM-dependent methyltransferase [Streptomyces sp. TLI_105]SED84926.1 Ubiquinone/menaquinone biosynthesis C-methylase UbiE [Streptomyces sp. TLI_105]